LLVLGGDFAVFKAPIFDGFAFDPFSLFDDGLSICTLPARVIEPFKEGAQG